MAGEILGAIDEVGPTCGADTVASASGFSVLSRTLAQPAALMSVASASGFPVLTFFLGLPSGVLKIGVEGIIRHRGGIAAASLAARGRYGGEWTAGRGRGHLRRRRMSPWPQTLNGRVVDDSVHLVGGERGVCDVGARVGVEMSVPSAAPAISSNSSSNPETMTAPERRSS